MQTAHNTVDAQQGETLREDGIRRAAQRADSALPGWSDLAVAFVATYALSHAEFAGEDARAASAGLVPEPPHLRAWGGVMTRAARQGFIRKTDRVRAARNPNVHCGNVNLWESLVCPGRKTSIGVDPLSGQP